MNWPLQLNHTQPGAPALGVVPLVGRASMALGSIKVRGVATQTLGTLPNIAPDRLALPALACAVTFPTAIVASIGTVLLLKQIFRILGAQVLALTLGR